MKAVKSLIVGDLHFKDKKEYEAEEFTEKLVAIAKKYKPTFTVLLGDILHTHETVKTLIHNVAEKLFGLLSDIAPLYVLIGNHDYINGQQFLTKNHIFGPFKRWKNVYIIDEPCMHQYEDKTFVFVPYVPPGRFVEALNLLVQEEETWELADCIFGHQEFKDSNIGNDEISKNGDKWSEEYPLVISGHIHEPQMIGRNIAYCGSSRQENYAEKDNKKIWLIDWSKSDLKVENCGLIKKINMHLRSKRTIDFNIEDIKDKISDYDEIIDNADCKIKLTGTVEEYNNFQRTDLYAQLSAKNIIFSFEKKDEKIFDLVSDKSSNEESSDSNYHISYQKIFKEVVSHKSIHVQKEYEKLFGHINNESVSSSKSDTSSECSSLEKSSSIDETD